MRIASAPAKGPSVPFDPCDEPERHATTFSASRVGPVPVLSYSTNQGGVHPPVGSGDPLLAVEVHHRAGSLHLHAAFAIGEGRAALFGPSGAGKSTLLRILAGLVQPDRGLVILEGHVLTDAAHGQRVPPGVARGIGMATQAPALFPHLTVQENLLFGLRGPAKRRGSSSVEPRTAQERVDELITLLDLAPLAKRKPALLSGGEQQRVALGRALAPRPRLLLLDEPFSALDTTHKTLLWSRLDPYLEKHRIASLLVSHDAAEVWTRAQTVIRIENGQATRQGPPATMLAQERGQVLKQFGVPAAEQTSGEDR